MTLLEVINAAAGHLEKNGVENARLNAEHLLAHALGMKRRLDLYLAFDRPLSDAERAPLRDLVRQRAAGTPLQHLLGTVEFHGHMFRCDARALIPRPETEQLVELLLARPGPAPTSVLDIGTGSGVIAVSLALGLAEANVVATDLSPDALALARENADALGVGDRIAFHCADLFPDDETRFDLIVANLPYIAAHEIDALSREVLHDPRSALDGGPDGLAVIARLIAAAPARLHPGGSLALEIGHDQADRVKALLAAHNYRDIATAPDYQGIARFAFATHG